MTEQKNADVSLEKIVSSAIKLPGVKVRRDEFLANEFTEQKEILSEILEKGPVEAGISRELLNKTAKSLILKRTGASSAASFAAGLPGGIAMAATVPADVLQFFGMSLRLAQELSYLYGADDLWQNGSLDDDKVKNQLILYCGVMFGVSGASAGVRVMSVQLAKTAMKKIPQKALTKTFWYPIVKNIGKLLSIHVTKSTVAKGISKAIPVIGGVISGSLNFASMLPMANRLHDTFDKTSFDYSQQDFENDLQTIESITENDTDEKEPRSGNIIDTVSKTAKNTGSKIAGVFENLSNKNKDHSQKSDDDIYEKLEKLKKLYDNDILSEEEYSEKKKELLSKL